MLKTRGDIFPRLFIALMVFPMGLCAGGGYEATGYLTYTTYGSSTEPTYKSVLMFQILAVGGEWRIRTEPVIKGLGGIGLFEASSWTNDSVLTTTVFSSAYHNPQSPFEDLRDWLIESKREEVFFTNQNPKLKVTKDYEKLFPPTGVSNLSGLFPSSNANNVAVATVSRGKFPPITASQIALLWFALTVQPAQEVSTNRFLFQIWDDGNHNRTRFRQARWDKFSEAPFLVSSAEYNWVGQQHHEDGRWSSINTADVADPLGVAARYEVIATTNLGEFLLPLSFKLVRFDTKQFTKVVSTVVASIVKARPISNSPSAFNFSGRTLITDYRLSAGELKGNPLMYIVDSNYLPSVEDLYESSLYKRDKNIDKRNSNDLQDSPSKSNIRWNLIAVFGVSSLIFALFMWKIEQRKVP